MYLNVGTALACPPLEGGCPKPRTGINPDVTIQDPDITYNKNNVVGTPVPTLQIQFPLNSYLYFACSYCSFKLKKVALINIRTAPNIMFTVMES